MSDRGKRECECFYTAVAAAALVGGIWLITVGSWWGWIIAPIGALGLLVAAFQ